MAIAGWGAHQVNDAAATVTSAQEEARQRMLVVQAMSSAHVHFKAEVLEWKNMLLRGDEAKAFLQHRNLFEHEATLVTEMLVTAIHLMRETGLSTRSVDDLKTSHADLLARYHECLARFDIRSSAGAHQADRLVRGVDRSTSAQFDTVSEDIDRESRVQLDRLVTVARGESRTAWWSVFDAVWLAIALAVGLALWVVNGMRQAMREKRQ